MTSANTNDLRGKILRIRPQPDGAYTIPDGNLFPKGTAKTRPEIYTMGHRNPFRISVDPKTNFLYWGDIGPDASEADTLRGPAGQDEVGQARKAGNYGWPYFVGDNKAYNQFDFATKATGAKFDAEKPVNNSRNNTGLKELPSAQKPLIWYPYAESKEFPLLGSGGRSAMAGPVFHSEDFKKASRAFPKYYDGKLLIYEWMRGWIMAVTLDKEGNYVSVERFMPSYKFSNPVDMEFADNGDMYMLEYGSGWFTANDDARLIRIEYNGGNRKPLIQVAADKLGGSIPLAVNLSSRGTTDADGDTISYSWKITSKHGYAKTVNGPDANLTFSKAGVYKATLTASDGKGGVSTQAIKLTAGNEMPVVSFDIGKSNKTFYVPNKTYQYKVEVKDKEDGSLATGKIKASEVVVNIDYLAEGFDKAEIVQGHRTAERAVNASKGQRLIQASDCKACHGDYKKSVGPSFYAVAVKYNGKAGALERLTRKVISGGKGAWGDVPMAAHPQLSAQDASEMVKYVLRLSQPKPKVKSLPVKGTYTTRLPSADKGQGVYIFRAAYTDRGANGLPGLPAEGTFTLRNPAINPTKYDTLSDVTKMSYGNNSFVIPTKSGSFIGLKQIDLTAIARMEISAMAPKAQLNAEGGVIELRMDAPNGKLLGKTEFIGDAAPSDGGALSFGGKPVSLEVTPTEGVHDIYLVFQNPKAKGGGSLMIVMNTVFKTSDAETQTVQKEAPKADLNAYVGKYKMTGLPFPYIEVSMQDGALFMKAGEQGGAITPMDGPDKFDAGGKATILFVRDERKRVSKLQMEAMGFKFEGMRE
jgi:cytochrome c